MRIGINSRIFQNKETGIPYYIKCLYSELLKLDNDNNYVFFQTNSKKKIGRTSTYNISNSIIGAFLFDNFLINKLVKQENISVFHGPASILPFRKKRGVKYIVTVPDLAFLVYPEHWSKSFFYYYKNAVKRSLRNSDVIIAISKNTKKDIIKFYGVEETKIKVLFPGINKIFFETKKKRLIKEKYFLSITTHPRRKNIVNVIRALAQNKMAKNLKYVIAGLIPNNQLEELNDIIKSLGLEDQIIMLGYVNELELVSLYQNAEFFIYPSFYEGFGLPIVEAMACRCPVISSGTSSMKEISLSGDWHINPNSIQDINNVITRMLTLSVSDREALISKNYEFSCYFTWEKSASQMKEVFENV